MDRKTPLYERHVALGGKIVSYAGYSLPVQYDKGVIFEHMAVREKCGIFDVSHMGEVWLVGKDALSNLQNLLCNDMSGMSINQVRYSPMCYENGGVVDDLLVYCMGPEEYMIVVNAANREKDVAFMQEHLFGDVALCDKSDEYAQIALQGPLAERILLKITKKELPKKYYWFEREGMIGEVPCIVSRTGYTGEKGFELYCENQYALALWDLLLKTGEEEGIAPCGLGARDTLRLEAGMPLYGHEMSESITPLDTGLGHFVKLNKNNFIGKEALIELGEPGRERIGIEVTGRGIAREACDVYQNNAKIGETTSGTFSPYFQKAIAMALVQTGRVSLGDVIEVDVRGRRIEGKIVGLPFYKRGK